MKPQKLVSSTLVSSNPYYQMLDWCELSPLRCGNNYDRKYFFTVESPGGFRNPFIGANICNTVKKNISFVYTRKKKEKVLINKL